MRKCMDFAISVLALVIVLVARPTYGEPLPQTNSPSQPDTSITVEVWDGSGHPLTGKNAEVTITADDGLWSLRGIYQGAPLTVSLSTFDKSTTTYTVSVHAPGFKSATSKHMHIESGVNTSVSLMLVPKHAGLDMDSAHWDNLAAEDPQLLSRLICNSDGPEDCSLDYEIMLRKHPENLAALLNITVALQQIEIGGRSVFSYYQAIGLDRSLHRDRFFAYVDKSLLLQLKADTANHHRDRPAADTPFNRLHFSWILHRHATSSFKEVDLPRANVQITFNEHDTLIINGIECVRADTDIDYYRRFAHGLKEVIPNLFLHKKSSPVKVFRLRWAETKKKQDCGGEIGNFDPIIGLKNKQQ